MTTTKQTTLVRGRWLLTGEETIVDGAIAIQDDSILDVGTWDTLQAHYPNASVLGSEQFAVMPGLINAHHHSNGIPNSLHGVDDDFLEPWLLTLGTMRSQDPTLKTLLSIAQLLQSGVTTVVDVVSVAGDLAACQQQLQARLHAYEQAGMRVAFTPGVNYESRLVHGEDEAFLASLPNQLQQQVHAQSPLKQAISKPDSIDLISDFVKQYKTHPHIDVWFGPPGPQWVGDELLLQTVEAADRLETQVQTHAVESFSEKLMGSRMYGKSVIAHLRDLGVLSPRFSIAHGVWVTEEDMAILAETGAAVSHNPSSNLRLRAGVAPLNAMLASSVTVGLGMDGTALGDDEDMFAEMRLAANLHRTPQFGSPAPRYADIFRLATAGSAKLVGQAHQLGKLAAGYKADVVLVKCDRITYPWIAPEANPLHVLFMRAKAIDVDTVLVNGKVVLQQGMPTGFDLHAVGQELAAQLNAASDRAQFRTLIHDLKPYLESWYTAWGEPPLTPFAAFNSRS
ncbi:MAG: amidohydrolase family protein [Leptolyngbyaceae cyanobacterium bins.302]|nr:amidohydrolase family protein [Leptolyngbyaceae cyanobacterium bins.302]